jgi:hypothetical protein
MDLVRIPFSISVPSYHLRFIGAFLLLFPHDVRELAVERALEASRSGVADAITSKRLARPWSRH